MQAKDLRIIEDPTSIRIYIEKTDPNEKICFICNATAVDTATGKSKGLSSHNLELPPGYDKADQAITNWLASAVLLSMVKSLSAKFNIEPMTFIEAMISKMDTTSAVRSTVVDSRTGETVSVQDH